MIQLESVAGRILVGICLGLVLGLIMVVFLPYLGISGLSMWGYGMVLWFVLMGIMIGAMGRFERHPLFGFRLYWWKRGPAIGLVFSILLVLLSYDQIAVMMESPLISWSGLTSPWWILLDGIFYGGLIAYVETKIAGDGNKLPMR